MAITVSPVARLRIEEEPFSAFGTDRSGAGTIAQFKDTPFVEGTFTHSLTEPLESPMFAQQFKDAQPLKVHMPKRGKVTFDIPLQGLGLSTGLRPQSALGRLLKVALGYESLGTGTTVNDASATTTAITMFTAAGMSKGGAIAFATGTGGRLEMREIKNISGNAVTLKHALSSAPANGSLVYASATYCPSNIELGDTSPVSLQLLYEGLETDDRWLYRGGQIASTPKITLANGGQPRISFDWQFASWFYADGVNTAGTFNSAALAAATYTYAAPLVVKDSELRIMHEANTSISSTLVDASSYEFNPNVAWEPQLAPGGLENIVRYNRLRSVPTIAGSFTLPYEDQTWWSQRAADSRRAFHLQLGSSPTSGTGGGVLLVAPRIQITDVQRVDIAGVAGQQVSWEGTLDADVTSQTNSLHYAPFRIHLF